MAKDVDLSSKEWLDIVFDGKNQAFGAYEMRKGTTKRHTKAVVIVLIIIGLLALGMGVAGVVSKYASGEEEGADASVEQQLAVYEAEEDEAEEEEETFEMPEPEIEEMIKEDVANQIQNTIIDVVEDDKVVNEVKTQDELREDDRQVGVQDISDGVDDLTKKVVKEEVIIVEEKKPVEDIVYTTANVQQQPQFPGGEAAMYKWLSEHIQYPPQAAEEGVDGRVTVQFVVTKTGAIENVQVVRPRHPALDKEAIRVVKSMPAWNPGRNNGQPVKVTFVLPVSFKLQK
mgnify:FL=1